MDIQFSNQHFAEDALLSFSQCVFLDFCRKPGICSCLSLALGLTTLVYMSALGSSQAVSALYLEASVCSGTSLFLTRTALAMRVSLSFSMSRRIVFSISVKNVNVILMETVLNL